MENWTELWEQEQYNQNKRKKIEKLKLHIEKTPENILDIGCGYAIESEYFQKEYGSYLYLLDGNPNPNKNRTINYGSIDTFNFYNDIEILKKNYDSRNLNYTFLDATEDIELPKVKFDFVYSFLSCGFHYPVSEYVPMLKECTDDNSLIMFDIRRTTFSDQVKSFKEYEIIHSDIKYDTVKVKL